MAATCIHDGTIVAVKKTPDARSGQIVVARFGDAHAGTGTSTQAIRSTTHLDMPPFHGCDLVQYVVINRRLK